MKNFPSFNTNNSLQDDSPITIGLNFPGTPDSETPVNPSDAHGAVGLDHIVELNNGRYRNYDKDTAEVLENVPINDFWIDIAGVDLDPEETAFDSRVVYDPFSERWFAAGAYKLSNPDTTFLVAVSNDSDPTQGWTGFELDPLGLQVDVDYPTLGFNSEGVFVVSGNEPGSLPVGGAMYVLPKDDLINGSIANATLLEISSTNSLGDTIQPVVNLDNTGQPHLLYRVLNLDPTVAFDRDIISGPINAPVLEEEGEGDLILVDPFRNVLELGGSKQPDTITTLDTVDSRLKSSLVLQNGTVWGVQDVGNNDRAAVRWFQIDAETNELLQEGLIADQKLDFFYGSLAVNEYGDVAIGFNGSGETQFASSFAVVGDTFGGKTTFSEPILLEDGIASYTDGDTGFAGPDSLRWADYSATVLDPEDPFTFWTFQTLPISFDEWTTQITEFTIPGISTFATDEDDRLIGTEGKDNIAGLLGDDKILGLGGNDVLRGDLNKRSPKGSVGGNDRIDGGDGNDRINGNGGDDVLLGGAGRDKIWGDDGDDLIRGGLGKDRLTGDDRSGGGSDTFVLAVGEGTDTITDFELSIDFIGLADGLAFGDLSFDQRGRNAIISFGDEDLAVLKKVNGSDLTEADFLVGHLS